MKFQQKNKTNNQNKFKNHESNSAGEHLVMISYSVILVLYLNSYVVVGLAINDLRSR